MPFIIHLKMVLQSRYGEYLTCDAIRKHYKKICRYKNSAAVVIRNKMNQRKPHNAFIAAALVLIALLVIPWAKGPARTGEAAPWKFAVISDTQADRASTGMGLCINEKIVKAIAEDVVREKPELVLVSGDLVNGWLKNGGTGYAEQYAAWKKAMGPVYRAGIRIYPVRGNHDSGPERAALPPLPLHLEPSPDTPVQIRKAFRDAFAESGIPENGPPGEEGLTYSFEHRNALFIGLDVYVVEHRVNQSWLDRRLAGNRNPLIFVFAHEPAFEKMHRDNLGFYPAGRDLFFESIGRAGGGIYFCGHDHCYDRSLVRACGNEVWQIIAGTGGGNLRSSGKLGNGKKAKTKFSNASYHGYVVVAVEGPKAVVSWKAIMKDDSAGAGAWRVLDSFIYSSSEQHVK